MLKESENISKVEHPTAEEALASAKQTVRRIRGSRLRRNTESNDFVMEVVLDRTILEVHVFLTGVSPTVKKPHRRIEDMALYL